MFRKNPNNGQMNFNDPITNMPDYVKKALDNSWAPPFYQNIFKNITEERFSVLYSQTLSRPNAPVNILIGLLILKELNHWTDEETIGALYMDYRICYALGITDFDKKRICLNTLGNFRARLKQYEEETGTDLLGEEVSNLTRSLIEVAGFNTERARQDSMMISANCKNMSRLELFYTVNTKMAQALKDNNQDVPDSCEHYFQKEDKNDYIYRTKSEEVPAKLERLLQDALMLKKVMPEQLKKTKEYKNLERLLDEQTEKKEADVKLRENKDIATDSLQNPSEPDATYRNKNGKGYIGYVLNLVEARDAEKNTSIIIQHEQTPNIKSDAELGSNALDKLEGVKELSSDGAYYSCENAKKAQEKGIEASYSAINGRKTQEDKVGAHMFSINEELQKITSCPMEKTPFETSFKPKSKTYTAKFRKEDCESCPLLKSCIGKERRRHYSVSFTEKKRQADFYRAKIGNKKYREKVNFRAGVEGIPSRLRHVYQIDKIPVRGFYASKIWVNCKVMAHNFKAFQKYMKKAGKGVLCATFGLQKWLGNLKYFLLQARPAA